MTGIRGHCSELKFLPHDRPDGTGRQRGRYNPAFGDRDFHGDESATEVVLSVRNNDRRLFDTGGDDCQDAMRVLLDAPLGDRRFRLDDGPQLAVTTYPVDAGG